MRQNTAVNNQSRRKRIAVVLLIVLAAGGGAWWYSTRRASDNGTPEASAPTASAGGSIQIGASPQSMVTTLADGATQVAVARATPGTISVTIEGPSVVEPVRSQDVRSRVAGLVISAAESGQPVAAGELLISLDNSEQRNAQRQAELNLAQAMVEREQADLAVQRARRLVADRQRLFDAGTIARDQLDDALESAASAELAREAAGIRVEQTQLAVETAAAALADTEITAPFSGVVISSNVGPGDVISANTVLMTFADVSRLRLNAEVDEFDIAMVEVGMPVVITADAMGRDSLSSTVERISPAAEVINNISIFTVSTVIRSTTTVLRPGMSADIAILISDDTGLVIPANAVSSVRGRSYLDVVEDGEVVTRRVVAGATNGTNTVILEGLGEEDLVVVPQLATFSLDSPAAEPDAGSSSLLPISVPGTGGSR